MAVTGIYYGIAEADLLVMRTNVLAQIAKAQQGKRFASMAGSGKSFSKDNLTLEELKGELAEIKAALQKANPAEYGKRVRRLHVDFSRSEIPAAAE